MDRTQLHTTLAAVAAALGDGWTYARYVPDSGYDNTVYVGDLDGPGNVRLGISIQTRGAGAGRLTIAARYDRLDRYSNEFVRGHRHSITVSPDKPATRIAGDIARRLLPDAIASTESIRQHIADHVAYVDNSRANAERLCSIVGGQPRQHNSSYGIYLRLNNWWGDAECNGEHVTLHLRSLSGQQAARILFILCAE